MGPLALRPHSAEDAETLISLSTDSEALRDMEHGPAVPMGTGHSRAERPPTLTSMWPQASVFYLQNEEVGRGQSVRVVL